MVTYTFKVAGETILKRQIKTPLPRRPISDREHQESTMRKWSLGDKPTAQQRISLRAWELQLAAGRVAHPSPCGRGRYKVLILCPYLIQAYEELYK